MFLTSARSLFWVLTMRSPKVTDPNRVYARSIFRVLLNRVLTGCFAVKAPRKPLWPLVHAFLFKSRSTRIRSVLSVASTWESCGRIQSPTQLSRTPRGWTLVRIHALLVRALACSGWLYCYISNVRTSHVGMVMTCKKCFTNHFFIRSE